MSEKTINKELEEELPWLPVLREWLSESRNEEGGTNHASKES
jgi:hypothetical protein